MRLFRLTPQIFRFEKIEEFTKTFKIGIKDLILTNEFLFDEFMRPLQLKAHFCFPEKYGGEPSDEMISQILSDNKNIEYNRVVAVGGGSVIDIAKLLTLEDAHNLLELFGKNMPITKTKELIVVPTTCGTGSEVTNISVVEIKASQTKVGLVSDELYSDYSVIIPQLIKKLPYKFFVYSSIDALIHAVESFVSPKSNCYTELFSLKAIEMIMAGYLKILEKGPEYRVKIIEDFLISSNYAGIAFGNTGTGAVHALSLPLGGKYHVPHGEANYQFFTEVFKLYNRKNPDGKIKEINKVLEDRIRLTDVKSANVYDALEEFLNQIISKKRLKEYGMQENETELFADSVIEKQQRLLVNNYVPLSREEILTIYKNLW